MSRAGEDPPARSGGRSPKTRRPGGLVSLQPAAGAVLERLAQGADTAQACFFSDLALALALNFTASMTNLSW